MYFNTRGSRESSGTAHRVWLQHAESLVAVLDPGSGLLAAVPGVLTSGALVYWQGKLRTERALALEYAVALEKGLRDVGLRAGFTSAGQPLGAVRGTIQRLGPTAAQASLSLHFLSSLHSADRGFVVTVEAHADLPLAWGLWSELCRYLPSRCEPHVTAPAGGGRSGETEVGIGIGLGYLTSSLDMQLIMEPYWKLRVTESLAKTLETYLATMTAPELLADAS